MGQIFKRSPFNPILSSRAKWWEAKGVLNPAVARRGTNIVMIYRAVGADGISRFGLAESADGVHFHRQDNPWWESALSDMSARLGVEDPRLTNLEGKNYLTYTKVAVEPATNERLSWEPAPFVVRSFIGVTEDYSSLEQVATVLPHTNSKDLVLFPSQIAGRYFGLIRQYPAIQLISSLDLRVWTVERVLLEPIPGTWEGERIGAGPPPVLTHRGWLLLYHGNEYLELPTNRRLYRMGIALLDAMDPSQVLYRHPEPVFWPETQYELEGPVGNVVFGTGLIDHGGEYWLYYGAGDGVIGLAKTKIDRLLGIIPEHLA